MADTAVSSAKVGAAQRRKKMGEGRRWLSTPGIVFLALVTQIPFVLTIYYSLRGWNLLRPDSNAFVGLRNFSYILRSADFYTVLGNTLYLTLSVVVITLVAGMGLALLLNRSFFGRNIVRTLLISPFLIMPVVAAVVWKNMMMDPVVGLWAYVAHLLGMPAIDLLAQYPMQSIIAIVSWQWTPFVMLILLAGLQSMPESILEAASIDGASGFTMFRYMILPHLQRFIEIALLLEMIFILNVFGIIFVTTSGGPGLVTTNLPYQIFLEAFSRWNIGRASAYGVFAVILANILVLMFLRVISSESEEVG